MIILSSIQKSLILILNSFKCKIIDGTKMMKSLLFIKDLNMYMVLGGIHGCISPGVYKSDDKYIIVDADVASLYPSIAVINNLYPSHLGTRILFSIQEYIRSENS